MKIYPTFRYQLRDQRTAILIYYAVLLCMILVSCIVMLLIPAEAGGIVTTNGVTAITIFFVFILSLCAFKESFLANLQHGISRRSQFLGHLGAMGVVCAIMAVADEIYLLLLLGLHTVFPNCFGREESLYDMVYSFDGSRPKGPLFSMIFSLFALLAIYSLGYLITVFMYRLHKTGKIIFWTGTPTLFILISAYLAAHPWLHGKVMIFISDVIQLCFNSLPQMVLTCTLLTVLLSGIAWLLLRRATIK